MKYSVSHFRSVYQNWRFFRHLSLSIWSRVFYLLIILFSLIGFTSFIMVTVEGMSLEDALWLSFTTVTTVGYGDLTPVTTIGRITMVACMYIFAISAFAILFAEMGQYFSLKFEQKITGQWEWKKMKNHIQIINTPVSRADDFLYTLISEIQQTPTFSDDAVQLLSRRYPEGLPNNLQSLKVLYRFGASENEDMLRSVNVDKAKVILVIARDFSDTISDSITFDVLTRIQEIGTQALVIAEAVDFKNRPRMLKAGADIIVRPHRARPELLVRIMAAPGTEEVLEDLFDYHGDHIERISVEFSDMSWAEIVSRVVTAGAGIPIAYVNCSGKVVTNPAHTQKCFGVALIAIVHEKQLAALSEVKRHLS